MAEKSKLAFRFLSNTKAFAVLDFKNSARTASPWQGDLFSGCHEFVTPLKTKTLTSAQLPPGFYILIGSGGKLLNC